MYDIIVIGAGPAGLTAGIYARRNNKKTLILEASTYGGQIVNTLNIENYPVIKSISGFEFATNLYNQIKSLDTEIKYERVTGIKDNGKVKEVITNNNTYECKAIIIATGSHNKKLDLEKEAEFVGKGVSYCATCDGAFFRNRDVAVIGGGNTAIEDAIYLSNIANKVYLILRSETFKAEEEMVNRVKELENVEIIYNSVVTSLNGKEKLDSIDVVDKDKNKCIINVSGVFVAIGRKPNNEIFKDLIELDENGYIVAGEDCHTNVEGIFVSGDNRKKDLRQLVTATSDGAIAASEAIKYINKK